MAKQREGRETEYYKGIIRQQRAEIKRLKRKLRELEKEILLREYDEEEYDLETTTKDLGVLLCPKCNIAMERVVILNRRFDRCEQCGIRTIAVIDHG